ncbi:MAG: hypothetical protein ABI927_08980, partial [Gaiellaceae bacterium]
MQPHALSTRSHPVAGVRYYRSERRSFAPVFAAVALLVAGLTALNIALLRDLLSAATTPAVTPVAPVSPDLVFQKHKVVHAPSKIVGAINPKVPGLTTFRGNLARDYYGVGPVPHTAPQIMWRYPRIGGMCSLSTDETGRHTWCGVGWTGQPNVIPHRNGAIELRFGAYDRGYHFLNAATGLEIRPTLMTGDLAKGSATSDPDGYPLYYAGSRDNFLRIVALDRGRPQVLWHVNADTSVPKVVWNNDWDGAPLVVGDYLIEGGENSWLYVIRLNRGYGPDGKVRVRPRFVARVPSWDKRLLAATTDRAFSIENSVSLHRFEEYLRFGAPPRSRGCLCRANEEGVGGGDPEAA